MPLAPLDRVFSEAPVPAENSETPAVLAKHSRVMSEFGACTGRTAYLWALNWPADARIHTVTLSLQDTAEYQAAAAGDDGGATRYALSEPAFDSVYYSGTSVAGKVHQLFADTKEFDETPLNRRCDLVFIDGSRAHLYVVSDSREPLRMVRSDAGSFVAHET